LLGAVVLRRSRRTRAVEVSEVGFGQIPRLGRGSSSTLLWFVR